MFFTNNSNLQLQQKKRSVRQVVTEFRIRPEQETPVLATSLTNMVRVTVFGDVASLLTPPVTRFPGKLTQDETGTGCTRTKIPVHFILPMWEWYPCRDIQSATVLTWKENKRR